jgi:hypothetical protein
MFSPSAVTFFLATTVVLLRKRCRKEKMVERIEHHKQNKRSPADLCTIVISQVAVGTVEAK